MIRIATQPKSAVPAWHAGFLTMLPVIHAYARGAFAHLNPEARQDMIQEVIANALVAYVRLYQQGRVSLAYPTVLARYGIVQAKDGRRVGAKLNIKDPLSRYCQKRKGVVVERLDRFDDEENAWAEAVVQDTRSAPVPEIVAFRCDFADWPGQPLPARPAHCGVTGDWQPHQRRRPAFRRERGPCFAVAPRAV
jgi:hypothetical protein